MSPSADQRAPADGHKQARTGTAGFTLVEMLVSMAIFLVIMGSIALLISGTTRTVRQGYAMLNNMERARNALAVLEQDIKVAFTTDDTRGLTRFYGEPNGFMYLGALEDGAFGRVAYVIRPGAETFLVEMPLKWSEVRELFLRQAPTEEALFLSVYPPVMGADSFYDFNVQIRLGSLLRYEDHTGATSLNAFGQELPVDGSGYVSDFAKLVAPLRNATFFLEALNNRDMMHRMTGGMPLYGFPRIAYHTLAPVDFWAEDCVALCGGDSDCVGECQANHPSWPDYEVVENLIIEAVLCDGGNPVYRPDPVSGQLRPVNALDLSSFFFYGMEDGTSGPVFNTLYNNPASRALLLGMAVNPGPDEMQDLAADFQAAGDLSDPEQTAGDPVVSRLPAWLAPGFWLYAAPARSDLPPMTQWYQQKVDLPAAYMRGSR
ncbi:MAG: prepilin-type N-terminal cleavage/methylation domain-containing protein [Candidatus Hydrogenedentes bacterium]|nr:prepilin-type N-terminal cleavage/methylation domain-containing protein [Candidatus Hydrogenedentota bacterium]